VSLEDGLKELKKGVETLGDDRRAFQSQMNSLEEREKSLETRVKRQDTRQHGLDVTETALNGRQAALNGFEKGLNERDDRIKAVEATLRQSREKFQKDRAALDARIKKLEDAGVKV
jgi:chromosome segregation ATPase